MLPWFCSWKRRGACSAGESMAARRNRKVEAARVSADRKKNALEIRSQISCVSSRIAKGAVSFFLRVVCSDAVPRKGMIHFERAYKTCCTRSLFLGEHREIIVLFRETQDTDLLKVVQDFILFLLMLRNLTSFFYVFIWRLGEFNCQPVFKR